MQSHNGGRQIQRCMGILSLSIERIVGGAALFIHSECATTGLLAFCWHDLPSAYVGAAALSLGPSSVYPKRAVPHAGTSAAAANAVALFAAPDGPRVRVRRLKFLLL